MRQLPGALSFRTRNNVVEAVFSEDVAVVQQAAQTLAGPTFNTGAAPLGDVDTRFAKTSLEELFVAAAGATHVHEVPRVSGANEVPS